ncbi:MAG: hypothetical protein M1817_004858 [Caeruleum heppii]|nr:MAG: hypothetical protein M1817_004858 [Caeruleum heppii]
MAEADYSQTILIVRAEEPNASEAFHLPHNAHRLVSCHFSDGAGSVQEDTEASSREVTPYVPRTRLPELRVNFDPKPIDPTRGFVFGSNKQLCDIVLDETNAHGISGRHFYIDFNWESGILRINNFSKYGTEIRAHSIGRHPIILKGRAMRMLHPTEQTFISAGDTRLALFIPDRGEYQSEYEHNWEQFRTECQNLPPELRQLDLHSLASTQQVARRKGLHGTYLLYDEIGRGEFGTV